MFAFIGQGNEYKNWVVMVHLYKLLVWPYLEYCVQLLSPTYKKDVINLEGVWKS